MTGRRWKFWGWGCEGDGLSAEEERRLLAFYRERIGFADVVRRPPPRVEEIALPAPRLQRAGEPRGALHQRALRAPAALLRQVVSRSRADLHA